MNSTTSLNHPIATRFVHTSNNEIRIAEEDEDEEDGNAEGAIDLDNVVPSRTRGKVIDFAKAAEENPADNDEDDEEDDGDFEEDDEMEED